MCSGSYYSRGSYDFQGSGSILFSFYIIPTDRSTHDVFKTMSAMRYFTTTGFSCV